MKHNKRLFKKKINKKFELILQTVKYGRFSFMNNSEIFLNVLN
jgi:hypothetical protein